MAPVKIIFCIDGLVRGGTELQLVELINRLDRKKYKPYLLTIRETEERLNPRDCEHLKWHMPSLFRFQGVLSFIKFVRFLRREKIDIVQTFFQDSTIFAGIAAKFAGVPVRIASCRDMAFWSSSWEGKLMKLAYRQMTGFICNANAVRDHYCSTFDIDMNKTTVIYNGIDQDSLPFIKHENSVTDIGIVGNMTRQVKRTDLFIKAAARVAKKYPEIRWHIVGDGHLRPDLERLAETLGIKQHCIFSGRIEDVGSYLEKLQIGVICSDSEGLSNALIEYMFRGVAPIATGVGGNTELIKNKVTGLVVPANNIDSLVQALETLVADDELRKKIAKEARSFSEKRFSWGGCVDSFDRFYSGQLLAGGAV